MSADASKPRMSVTGSPEDYKPTYGDPKKSTSNDVAFQKDERRTDISSGPKEPLKIGRVGANVYPGRPTPAAEAVKDVTCAPAGTAKKQADKQLQEQRQDLK